MFTLEFKDNAGCREKAERIVGCSLETFAAKFIRAIIAHKSSIIDPYKSGDSDLTNQDFEIFGKLGFLVGARNLINIEGTCINYCDGGDTNVFFGLDIKYRLDCGPQRGKITVVTQFVVHQSFTERLILKMPGLMRFLVDGVDTSFEILGSCAPVCSIVSNDRSFQRSEEFS